MPSVEYNPAFRLYLTTRLAQPQLDAKTSEQVAMINFRLDHDGLRLPIPLRLCACRGVLFGLHPSQISVSPLCQQFK